jgi:hypothetical protein
MSWRNLLQTGDEALVSPWVGGRSLRSRERAWLIEGRLPAEHGWFEFKLTGRKARVTDKADAAPLDFKVRGYLVGDRLIPDDVRVDPDPMRIIEFSEPVALIEPGLPRFVRICAGRMFHDGPLVYESQEMPLGPEDEVLHAFQDQEPTVAKVVGLPSALDAAFRMETWQRVETARVRAELERVRLEEEARLAREEQREQLRQRMGDAAGRRELALIDFAAAARAALAIPGAEYLDHRPSALQDEMVVQFRFNGRRFECVAHAKTLRIIDSGICLIDHHSGEDGNTYFTLESLPAVIREAQQTNRLVVRRHVDGQYAEDRHDDEEDEDY